MARQISQDIRAAWDGARWVGFGLSLRTLLYPARRAWYQRRFPSGAEYPPQSAYALSRQAGGLDNESIGDIVQAVPLPQGVALQCENASATLEAITPEIFRLRVRRGEALPSYFSYATILTPLETAVQLDIGDEEILVGAASFQFRIHRHPFSLRLFDAAGEPLMGEMQTIAWHKGSILCAQDLAEAVQLYGLGERACLINCRGQHFHLTTLDPESYHLGEDPLYKNIPFLLQLYEGRAMGMFFDSTYNSNLDLGNHRPDALQYVTTGPELRIDFIAGPQPQQVVERYTALTGRMNLPPLWTLGYHQSRWSYDSDAIVRELARTFREKQIPCDAIHFDIDYMDGFRCFTWDREDFPDPPALLSFLHEHDFKAVGMIDPGIKVDPDYPVCAEGVAKDMFCKLPDGSLFHGPVWPGECYFPDFTSPRVRAWWGTLYQGLVADGFDGFWNDMNEPTIFGGNTFPGSVQHDLEGRGGDHRQAHSIYGMQMARATFEGLNHLRPNMRNWVFTRSGYAGVQRYASVWTGDNYSDWEHLRLTPAMLINSGLSGVSFTGPDVGGFAGSPTPELFGRWISMGAFTPFYRTHTAKYTPAQEPWSFGPEVEAIARTYIEWRYRLLPYLYTAFWQCSHSGLPIMRPLFFEDPAEPDYHTLDDQWLLGDHLLISPVLTPGARERSLHLPTGTWYDFWSQAPVQGPSVITRPAPLDLVPVHVRGGAVLPLGPVRQHSGDKPSAPLQLHLYPGDGVSWLYEDDGATLAYRRGAYRLSRLRLEQGEQTLSLRRKIEGDFAPAYEQMQVVLHGGHIAGARADGHTIANQDSMVNLPASGWEELLLTLA